nr:hypothetical protein [Tanacetum cinerariifolium]
MLTIRARRFIKRIGRNSDINGKKISFDISKVKCFNCHKNGHFVRDCRAPKNQENRGRKYGRKTVPVENPTENALIAQDEIRGYDWSYQAEEEHLTNYPLMALTSSRSSSSSDFEVDSCSRTCIKAYLTLKEQYDSLSLDYKMSQFNLIFYKAGLQFVEERLAHYKKIKVVFEDKINILNLKVKLRDNALVENIKKLEKAEKERDGLKLTLGKFENSSKSLNNLLGNQVSDKVKTGLGYKATFLAVESFVNSFEMIENKKNVKSRLDKGYHVVPSPYTGNYIPPKPDIMFIDEQVKSESVDVVSNVASSDVKTGESKYEFVDVKNKDVYSTVETKPVRMNSFSPPIIEDWNSDDESKVEFESKVEVKIVRPTIEKIKFVKTAREKVEKGRIAEINANEDIFLIDKTTPDQGRIKDQDLFRVHDLDGDEVFVDVTTGENVEQDAIVAKIVKGVTIQEPSEFRTTSPPQSLHDKDKGKGIMVEPKKPLKKKDQIALDEEVVRKLEAEMKAKMDEEERIAREKNEANRAIIE